jgi:hypothetical protein
MRRFVLLLLCATFLLAPPPAVLAQSSPFGPLPPAAPAPTATPDDSNSSSVLGQDVGRLTLYLIAGGFVILFVGIGWWISRDARSTLPSRHRPDAAPVRLTPAERRKRDRARSRARDKTRAQKAARKAHRKR